MGLKKEIILNNGIQLNYHRIVSINKVTNNSTIIEVASYINEDQRQKEVDYYASEEQDIDMNVFIETQYISKEYNEADTIEDCYDFLKTLEQFEGAKDI